MPRTRPILALIALALGLTVWSQPAQATHFRGGSASWVRGSSLNTPIAYPGSGFELLNLTLTSPNTDGVPFVLPEIDDEVLVGFVFDAPTDVSHNGQTYNVETTMTIITRIRKRPDLLLQEWDALIEETLMSIPIPGGPVIQLRLSPEQASTGLIQVTDLPDGTFQVDGFFDIWTEVQFDGTIFRPDGVPLRAKLEGTAVPEPASMGLLGTGLFALLRRHT